MNESEVRLKSLLRYLGLADAELLQRAIVFSLEIQEDQADEDEDEDEVLKMAMAMSLVQDN